MYKIRLIVNCGDLWTCTIIEFFKLENVMRNTKYTDEFHPRKGDRVYCEGKWRDLVKGIIVDIVKNERII